jgi:hypothetical protein
MSYEFKVERAPKYLHVTGRGDNSEDNLRRFLLDSYRAAVEHDCDTLLMELNFAGRSLSIGSIYSVIAERSSDGSQLRHVAFVDTNLEHPRERGEFAELAASRMGVSVRCFPSVAEARRSLEEQ